MNRKRSWVKVLFAFNLLAPATAFAAASLSSVSLTPATVVQGTPSIGTVTLNAPAPTGGAAVTLTSSNAAAVVNPSVTVSQGATTAQFVVDTMAVTSSTQVTITATYNGVTISPTFTITPRVAVRGVTGDLWADVIIGQPNFGDFTPLQVASTRLFQPGGVEVDRTVKPNRVYAYDGGNSRVLGLSHLGTCSAGVKAGQWCTGNSDCSGSICNVQEGIGADLVIGQPSSTTSGCNGDSGYQNFPTRAPASASTLCGMPEAQVSIEEGFSFAHLAVDSAGNLYVPDFDNNRVLRYNSPFTTDTIADYVWGQADFTGNGCNRARGNGLPDAQSFCFRSIFNEGFTGGVEIDSSGNLWVSDNANHRVLRFPKDPGTGIPMQSADLVLGQPDLVSANPGAGLNQMCAPAGVRVDSAGNVYVADSQLFCGLGSNGRILIFNPPLSSGMSATSTLGEGLFLAPQGLELDPAGGLWVNDTGNNQFLFFPTGSSSPTKVLSKDVPDYSGTCDGNFSTDGPPFVYADGGTAKSSRVCGATGGIGINDDGDIFVSAWSELQDMWRFPAPIPAITPGIAHSADKRIFVPMQFGIPNQVGASGFDSSDGLAVGAGQLVVADYARILFWNDPSNLTSGQAADGYIATQSFLFEGIGRFGRITADKATPTSHLWALDNPDNQISEQIEAYSLPLTTGATPSTILTSPLPVLGGGTISWDFFLGIGGIAASPDGSKIWIADPDRNRVFRVSNPLTNPIVDIVLGQFDPNGTLCNQGNSGPSQTSLCMPGAVTLDPQGNLYVSDGSLEVSGNLRLLEFDASLFPANPSTAVFGIGASRVFGRNGSFTEPNCQLFSSLYNFNLACGPLQPAFTSDGQMVLGLIGYVGSRFPLVYTNPLVSDQVSTYLNDFSSYGGYSAVFDSNDDLYINDLDRARVLVYRHPLTTGGAPAATLSATSLTFATQLVGTTSAAKTVTLTNTGNATLVITSITASGDFAQTSTCGASLAAGANCAINVTFTAKAAGTRSGTLTLIDNASGSPQTVALKGTGTVVSLSPKSLNFGSVPVGSTSAAKTVTLKNTGATALKITSISITGTNAGDFAQTNTCPISPSTLGAGASCKISVTFTPSAKGARTAQLSVSDNGGGSPQKVTLSGTGS